MTTSDGQPRFERATGVVWRVAADRVLLHRIGVPLAEAALELSGRVAFVWAALDEPGTAVEIADRMIQAELAGLSSGSPELDVEMVAEDLLRLVGAAVVDVAEPEAGR